MFQNILDDNISWYNCEDIIYAKLNPLFSMNDQWTSIRKQNAGIIQN